MAYCITRLLACEWAAGHHAVAPGYVVTNTAALRVMGTQCRHHVFPCRAMGRSIRHRGRCRKLLAPPRPIYGAVMPVDGGWLAR
jgi:hypothetical protein